MQDPFLIAHDSVALRRFVLGDASPFVAMTRANADFFAPFSNPPLTTADFRAYLERTMAENFDAFAIQELHSGNLIGAINMSQIVRGAFQSAYLGYYVSSEYSGKGYMETALKLLVKYAFTNMELHRLEANIQRSNHRSIGLVRKCGFELEGYSAKYLKLNGVWCDHERWAIHQEIWKDDLEAVAAHVL